MYAGPRTKPLPSVLNQEDPDARRELQAIADLRREDKEMEARYGTQEFGSEGLADDFYADQEAEQLEGRQEEDERHEAWMERF